MADKDVKLTNVITGGTPNNQYKGLFHKSNFNSKKAQAALALAVSLWIGGSGVAMAASEIYTENDEIAVWESGTTFTGDAAVAKYPGDSDMVSYDSATKNFSFTGGTWKDWKIKGGRTDSGNISGYSVELKDVVSGENYGQWLDVIGAYTGNGNANGNRVKLVNSIVKNVYGSDSYNGEAQNNIVTLENSTVYGYLHGGLGAIQSVTGNTLNLYGANSAFEVINFETINIKEAKWGTPALRLTGPGIENQNGTKPTINTVNINFSNLNELPVKGTYTILIQNKMANYPTNNIAYGRYTVGTTLEGTGTASVADGDNDGTADDLIYTADTGSEASGGAGGSSGGPTAREQTHNTVMGAEVGMAALSAGNDFVGAATEGLAMAGNAGADGLATYANMGGGSMNVETGSHVKTHTWNAILALGHKNEKKLSSTEYGAFFEYGKGNYTTYAEGNLRGDGSSSYTGGGILGKWQKNNGFYVEGSLRAGSIHDDAHNVLRDGAGNPYSYDTDATYWGAHIGVGREIKLNKTDVLDLYAKYFYNHRGSVSFDAGGHYDLGAVESSVLRVGTRYTVKQNDNINYYGGLAVEHEFCGRASGFADGVAIRGADISGTSVRGEIGAKFKPDEKSNVTLDLNLSGFAGKKEGLTGGLSAVFHF